MWTLTACKSARWMQACTMDGFPELKSLNSINSRLSKTDSWYETFQQLVEQAVHADTVGNESEAEVLYHQCKVYLEQAAESNQEVLVSPCLAIALSWVYLALANLYRYNLREYWKAIECLLLLLSTRAKIVSSSDSINEIRFALCLTVFEWIDGLEECDHSTRKALLVVPLEEARDIVDDWKTLDDPQVTSSLAYMLSRGYATLEKSNERKSYWDQRFTTLMMQFVTTGDPLLDSLPQDSSVEFENFPKKIKTCLHKFREFGAKAKTATAAGNIPAAVDCYKQCEAAVEEAGDELPTSKRGILLVWVYERLGHAYRFDMVDLLKATECYRAYLSALETIKAGGKLDSNIIAMRFIIIEMMYERAHSMDDEEKRNQLVAEAVLEVRKLFPQTYDDSVSDLDVKNGICCLLSHRYEDCGRTDKSLYWNEERLKLMHKKMPKYEDVRLRSAYLLLALGEAEAASKMVPDPKKLKKLALGDVTKESSHDAERSLANLPFVSQLNRFIYHQRYNENPESGLFAMTNDQVESQVKDEDEWAKRFLEIALAQNAEGEIAKEITKRNLLVFEAERLVGEGKLVEAISCFQKCLVLISEGHADNSYTMGCLSKIGACHSSLFVKALRLELKPSGAGSFPGHGPNFVHTFHFHQSFDYLQKGLQVAEQQEDIYQMADFNKLLGILLFKNWQLVLPRHEKLSSEGYGCLRSAVNFFKASGRNLNRFLYSLEGPHHLWVSVLERNDDESSAYYHIQRSVYEIIGLEYQQISANLAQADSEIELLIMAKFLENANIWRSQALLWAERGHSRTLAFKLTERNMGHSTRSELQKFDTDDWGEAWASIRGSRDVCGPGTVMVEYIKTEHPREKFFIYVVSEDGKVDMQIQDKPKEDLGTLLTKLNNHMSQKANSKLQFEELMKLLEDLYEAFISPIQRVLDSMEDHHKLVISANKILAGVPFAALRNPRTKKFLIERHTVVCTPSLRILKQCDQRLRFLQRHPLMESTGAALVLGDPAFSPDGSNRLMASGDEADKIAAILGHQNVLVLKGKNALKNEVLDWTQLATTSGKYQALVHLATHGKGADDNFKEGALQFADPKVEVWPPVSTLESADMSNLSLQSESEVRRSEETSSSTSVPLSQAHEQEPTFQGRGRRGPRRGRVDPRHLTSEEIVKDYEWRMLLVVLSACETAKGEVKSEGTLNLARALLISGVPSTVVSQWKVDDASTPVLMEGLYRAMTFGMDVASALRASMMAMIRDNYHIHQWAPFVVMGLGTVMLPKQFLV